MGDFKQNGSGRGPPLQEVAAEKIKAASAWLRDYITAIKKGKIHPFTTMERKVREATRNEAWSVLEPHCSIPFLSTPTPSSLP